ncbi:hypothetical protein EDC96DRAFT_451445 [Choanephora cucurbitarum]|nr:hypothetical protein EDC96DRAFT_451445 [Choanephora cucurbitarum]
MTLSIKKRIKRLKQSTCESDKRIDFTHSLFSKELVLKVFGFLSSSDLIQCAAVNYRWFQIANDELLWKPLFIKTFSTHEKPTAIRYGGSWKTKYRIHHNWLLGNYTITDLMQRPNTPHHIHDAGGQLHIWQIHGLSSADLVITPYLSHQAHPALSLGWHYPLLSIYTVQKTLVVYRLEGPVLVEIACLQSPMDWSPVIIDIQPRSPHRWQIVLCFGSSHSGPSSVGIQEMIFSDSRLLSSRQGMYPMSLSCASGDQITSMVYAAPYLITAHANNTMKQYRINKHLDISLQQTLYGHTCRVDALAIAQHKLISGDRSGIKVWDLARQQEVMTLNAYPDQSSMNELPDSSMRALGFDEDKIVAIVNDNNHACVRLWSFN